MVGTLEASTNPNTSVAIVNHVSIKTVTRNTPIVTVYCVIFTTTARDAVVCGILQLYAISLAPVRIRRSIVVKSWMSYALTSALYSFLLCQQLLL